MGQQVRARIFGDDFWPTLLAVAAPFPVLLLALAAYHFATPRLGRRAARGPATAAPTLPHPASP